MKASYLSTGQNPFNTWKVTFFGFPLAWIIIKLLFDSTSVGFWSSLILNILIFIALSLTQLSTIKRNKNIISFSDFDKRHSLVNITSIETWWSYDFSGSSPVFSDGATGQTRAHANKIFIYAKLNSESSSAVIVEEIQLSDKFPNNHIYKATFSLIDLNVFKVWNVDQCIKKLELQTYLLQS